MCCRHMCICDFSNESGVAPWTIIIPIFLIFVHIIHPGCSPKMGSVPQGMFAAYKVHIQMNENADQNYNSAGTEKTFQTTYSKLLEHLPHQYNSKLMNSIWGLYNRYSVHNVKQHIDKNAAVLYKSQHPI